MWMQGEPRPGRIRPANPAGYFAIRRRGFVEFAVGRGEEPARQLTFEQQVADTMIIAGTPSQVIERLKYLVRETRPGIMGIWANDGSVSKEDRRRCIQLLCGEVMPAIKEYGASLGLKDPWEANARICAIRPIFRFRRSRRSIVRHDHVAVGVRVDRNRGGTNCASKTAIGWSW